VVGGCTNDTLHVWDLQQPENQDDKPLALHGHTAWVTSVAIRADGAMLASGSGDQTVRVWNLRTGELLHTLYGHHDWIYGVAYSPNLIGASGATMLASCGADRTICVWEFPSGQLVRRLHGHRNTIRSVAFSPDGTLLASGSTDETIKLWDIQTGECLHTLRAPRPYEGMDITGAIGITNAQKAALRALGAVYDESARAPSNE
jgi:WD40 repeat protein